MPKQKVTVKMKNSEDTTTSLNSNWVSGLAKVSEEAACPAVLGGPIVEWSAGGAPKTRWHHSGAFSLMQSEALQWINFHMC